MKRSRRQKRAVRSPSQERALATVEAILEATARIVEREGLGASFTCARIAREAGVGVGSLYEYFASKDAILIALAERHVAEVRALVDAGFEAFAALPLDEAIDRFVDALFALHAARPKLHERLQNEFPRHRGLEPFIESDRYLEGRLSRWLDARAPEGPCPAREARCFVAVRAVRATVIHAFAEGLDEARRAEVRVVVKGLLGHLLT